MSSLQRTARLFRRHRRRWISAVEIVRVGGLLAWRTRVSECRRLLGMRIENETTLVGKKYRSRYRYLGKA